MDENRLEKQLKTLGSIRVAPPVELVDEVQERISGRCFAGIGIGAALVLNLLTYAGILLLILWPGHGLLWRLAWVEAMLLVTNVSIAMLVFAWGRLSGSTAEAGLSDSLLIKIRRIK